MKQQFALIFRKELAEILDEDPSRYGAWASLADILRERFHGLEHLVTEFFEEEESSLAEHFKLRGLVHPAQLSRAFGKKFVFLFLDARAISFSELQNLLKCLQGQISWYNVYGDYDVVLKCLGDSDQIESFAEEQLTPRGVSCKIIPVQSVCIYGGRAVPAAPVLSSKTDSAHVAAIMDNYLTSEVSETKKQQYMSKRSILGPVCIEDTTYTERCRALVAITFVSNWKRMGEFPASLVKLQEQTRGIFALYRTGAEYAYLIEAIARDNTDLDLLTDRISDMFEGIRPSTFVVARTVVDPWPTPERLDIQVNDIRVLAEQTLRTQLSGTLDHLYEATLESLQSLEPRQALSVIGVLTRLRDLDLDFLSDQSLFGESPGKNVEVKFRYAMRELERGFVLSDYAAVDAAMNAAGTALEGILRLALQRLVGQLFPRQFEPRVRSRLGLPNRWWAEETRLSLEKLQHRYEAWSNDKILSALFLLPAELMPNLTFAIEIRNRASHHSARSSASRSAFIQEAVAVEDALVQIARVSRVIYEKILARENLATIQVKHFQQAVVAAAVAQDQQALEMLIFNDHIDVRLNEAMENARREMEHKGFDLRRTIELIEREKAVGEGDLPAHKKWTFEQIKSVWAEKGTELVEQLPNRVWAALWGTIDKQIDSIGKS